jgi:hypothetical protein
MLQAVRRKCLPSLPVRPHHTLDEHLGEMMLLQKSIGETNKLLPSRGLRL